MAIKLAPGLVDAAAAWLTANIQTHCTAEETIWNDGILLPRPTEIVLRDPDNTQRVNEPPYLHVFVESSSIYDFRAAYAMSTHRLITWLIATNADPETLRKMIGRYGNILFKALNAWDTTASAYRLADPEPGAMPEIDFGMTLTDGTMAMNDVRVETHWTVREE